MLEQAVNVWLAPAQQVAPDCLQCGKSTTLKTTRTSSRKGNARPGVPCSIGRPAQDHIQPDEPPQNARHSSLVFRSQPISFPAHHRAFIFLVGSRAAFDSSRRCAGVTVSFLVNEHLFHALDVANPRLMRLHIHPSHSGPIKHDHGVLVIFNDWSKHYLQVSLSNPKRRLRRSIGRGHGIQVTRSQPSSFQ